MCDSVCVLAGSRGSLQNAMASRLVWLGNMLFLVKARLGLWGKRIPQSTTLNRNLILTVEPVYTLQSLGSRLGLQSVMVDRLAEFDASALVGVGEIRTWNFHSTPPKRFESLRNSPPLYALKKTVTVTVPVGAGAPAAGARGRGTRAAAPRIGDRSWYTGW